VIVIPLAEEEPGSGAPCALPWLLCGELADAGSLPG